MIRGALVASCLSACWSGATPPEPPAPKPVRAPAAKPRSTGADISAIKQCDANGAPALVLHVTPEPGERLEAQLVYGPGARLPATFTEGSSAEISICAFHGCTESWVRIDSLELGVGARGRYHVEANAGPTWDAPFEAAWTGTPWAVRPCPYEMNPP